MTLPAAAARAPACSCRWISAARAQAAASGRCRQTNGRTDGRTDTRPLHRQCTAYYAGSISNNSQNCNCVRRHLHCGPYRRPRARHKTIVSLRIFVRLAACALSFVVEERSFQCRRFEEAQLLTARLAVSFVHRIVLSCSQVVD